MPMYPVHDDETFCKEKIVQIDVFTTFNNCFNQLLKLTMDAMLCAGFRIYFKNTL